ELDRERAAEVRVLADKVCCLADLGEAPFEVLDEGHRGIPIRAERRRVSGAQSSAVEAGGKEHRVVGHGSRWGLWGSRRRTLRLPGARGHPPIDVNGMNRSGCFVRGGELR